MQTPASKVEHLYLHVPFCAAKCHYCAFYSEAGGAARMEDYVDAAVTELEQYASQLQPATVFFGGGTPSLLPAPLMRRLLEAVGRTCAPTPPLEWTIECNPSTVSAEKARLFRESGVNRISMGVQSLDDELLEVIGRVHSVKAAIDSYEKLRAAGFDNINLDFIFGLPGQTMDHWRRTLDKAIALQPEHISTYCLILEEDTEFWSLFQKGLIRPNEDQELAMYQYAIETLAAAGYHQYEISNFSKSGRECAHNIAYWEAKDYLGIGPSACSTIGAHRWQNAPDTERYIAELKATPPRPADEPLAGRATPPRRAPTCNEETLTPELRAAERAAFGMRMNAGVPAELVRGRWDNQIADLLSADLVHWRQNRLAPTKRGLLFADQIAAEFV